MICKMKCLSLISLLVLSLPVQLLAWFPGLDQTTVTDTICQHALYYSAGNVEPSRTSPPFRIILEQKSWLPKTSMKGKETHIQLIIHQYYWFSGHLSRCKLCIFWVPFSLHFWLHNLMTGRFVPSKLH